MDGGGLEGDAALHALRAELSADCTMYAGQLADQWAADGNAVNARQLGWRTSALANAIGGGAFFDDGAAKPERTVARRTGPMLLSALDETR